MSVRFLLGGVVLIPVILFRNKVYKNSEAYKEGQKGGLKALLIGGIIFLTALFMLTKYSGDWEFFRQQLHKEKI